MGTLAYPTTARRNYSARMGFWRAYYKTFSAGFLFSPLPRNHYDTPTGDLGDDFAVVGDDLRKSIDQVKNSQRIEE